MAARITKEVVEVGVIKTTSGAIRVTKIILEVGITQNIIPFEDTINNWNDTVSGTLIDATLPLSISAIDTLNNWNDASGLVVFYSFGDSLNNWNDSLLLLFPRSISTSDTLSFSDYSVVIRYAVGTFVVQIFDNTANVKGKGKDTSSLKDSMIESIAIYYEGQDMSLQLSDTLDLEDEAYLTYPWGHSESLNLNDFVSLIMATPLDLSDILVITDAGAWIFSSETQTISAVDTIFLYDIFQSGINQPEIGDSLNLVDTFRFLLNTNGIFSDTLSLNDINLHNLNALPMWFDTLGLSDDVGMSLSTLNTVDVGDSFTPSDGFESHSGTGETSYIRRYLNDLWRV